MLKLIPFRRRHRAPDDESSRRGAIVVLAAAMLVMILGFAAFTTDIGWISVTKAQLQNAADSAALAAAMELNPLGDQGTVAANVRQAVEDMAELHPAGEMESVYIDTMNDVQLGRRTYNSGTGEFTYEWGVQPYNCVRVTASRNERTETVGGQPTSVDRRLPLFFAPILGHDKAVVGASAIATYQPRDMVLVLDFSASMNDDSEFVSYDKLGQSAVDANIYEIWQDLGSPTYGSIDSFEPEWVVFSGQPASGQIPHIDITHKRTSIYVVSTKTLSSVKLTFSNGNTQNFYNLSSKTGTFQGSGSNSGKIITEARVTSGSNGGEHFEFDADDFKEALGLDDVSYPYEGGSWDDYIDYVTYSDWYYQYFSNYQAGYHFKFGMKNLINYWNEYRPLHSDTSALWKTRQQPVSALKDATKLLLDRLVELEAEDNVGLAIYTYPDATGAKLEHSLTPNYSVLKTTITQRQAGHYDQYTNIGAGIRKGREELLANARPNALRMMVLVTDGLANRSLTGASPTQFALDEAQLCKDAGIKIMTVSVGVDADRDLMQQIADLTAGTHFNVPPGATVEQYEEELLEIFGDIASDRPLKLIYE